ncbi:hypothetical protein ASPZODRAFT_154056 [Penicilliopsis zonata CBS 506.65]|uniref:Gfo/Idh/MocA-like oxidoreductase N-terminal domain-containing protein n=1 Tax=Penicilliopsis zonata CBS 506.65 TaxID=1073090 RepID=A0A1L9SAF8_9EURO|nr:hypothetical protein ASPZODRAFT_154056 [Penicilliopsis zonata CBS 506.65]OJJ44089.1 hypothetical protein ASPZODRAFT_154056 [Penicilliopsis zonata CBS 506.65]
MELRTPSTGCLSIPLAVYDQPFTSDSDHISYSSLDVIYNLLPPETSEAATLAALAAGKHVVLDTLLAPSLASARRILAAASSAPNNARVFVSSARRNAPCFTDVFKAEVASLERIHYVRCRGITGRSPAFVTPAGIPFTTVVQEAKGTDENETAVSSSSSLRKAWDSLLREVFKGQELTPERVALRRFLTAAGCHDLSVLRDTLGVPESVSGISINVPFYSATFHYTDRTGHPFAVLWEAGVDDVSRCDAHLTVYAQGKTLSVEYDYPYHPRATPARVLVQQGADTKVHTSSLFESYAALFKRLHRYLTTTAAAAADASPDDAVLDLRLFRMIFDQYDRQCGTIRTPLG